MSHGLAWGFNRAVCHAILEFSARVFATVVARQPEPPQSRGVKRRLWRERLSIRGWSRHFPVSLTGSPELAGYAVENSRRKLQNVVTDSSALRSNH